MKNLQQLTGISEEDLFWLKTENAIIYLKEVMGCDEWATGNITKSRLFWDWWLNQWERRDQIIELPTSQTYEINAGIYKSWHDPLRLNIRPHTVILRDTFDKMISRVIDKEVNNG